MVAGVLISFLLPFCCCESVFPSLLLRVSVVREETVVFCRCTACDAVERGSEGVVMESERRVLVCGALCGGRGCVEEEGGEGVG